MEKLLNFSYDWSHSKIIYDSPRMLYKLAAVKEAVKLYHEQANEFTYVNGVFHKVQKNLQLMVIPEVFKTEITLIAELMKERLCKFIKFLPKEFSSKGGWSLLREKIYWTSQGTIDKLTTAEALVDANDLDVTLRFQIATLFFLENKINTLSVQMPHNYALENKVFNIRFDMLHDISRGIYYELSKMDGISIAKTHFKIPEIECAYKNCFIDKLEKGNEFGCQYYWQRLSEQERHDILESLKPKFIDWHRNRILNFKFTLFILFTHCNMEGRLQLLQDEQYNYALLQSFLDLEFLHIFDECIKEVLKLMTFESVVNLIDASAKRIEFTKSYKRKYVEIGSMLFQHICEENSVITSSSYAYSTMFESLNTLVEEGETELMRIFFDSVSKKWIEEQFSYDWSFGLKYLIMAALEAGMLELLFNYAFPTPEKRNEFCETKKSQVIDDTMEQFILKGQISYIDKLLSSLFLSSDDIKSFKQRFVKENSFNLCFELLWEGRCKCANKFVKWCSEFCKKDFLSFKSEFVESKGSRLCYKLIESSKWQFLNNYTYWCFSSDKLASQLFKMKFSEENGSELCFTLLEEGEWESVKNFLHWCFSSDRKALDVAINSFYDKFCKSEFFAKLFHPENSAKPIDVINSLSKLTSLKKHFNSNAIVRTVKVMKYTVFFFCLKIIFALT